MIKNLKTSGIKYNGCNCFLEYRNLKEDLIEYKYLCCNKKYQKKFDENLKTVFFNTYKLFNHDINKSILLLQKCIYPYKYLEGWKKLSKISLTEKNVFTVT